MVLVMVLDQLKLCGNLLVGKLRRASALRRVLDCTEFPTALSGIEDAPFG